MGARCVSLIAVSLLVGGGCDPDGAAPPPAPSPDQAESSTEPEPSKPAAAKPLPAPKSVPMSQMRPRPKRVRFGMVTMGKGPVDQYEIELDLEDWTLSGTGRWDEKSFELPEPTPLSPAQRKTVEPTIDSMRLVTDSEAVCKAKNEDPLISCGSSTSIAFDGEVYSGGDKSCQYVDYADDADPHEAVGSAFRSLATTTD
jgi:hypothetical protein